MQQNHLKACTFCAMRRNRPHIACVCDAMKASSHRRSWQHSKCIFTRQICAVQRKHPFTTGLRDGEKAIDTGSPGGAEKAPPQAQSLQCNANIFARHIFVAQRKHIYMSIPCGEAKISFHGAPIALPGNHLSTAQNRHTLKASTHSPRRCSSVWIAASTRLTFSEDNISLLDADILHKAPGPESNTFLET